MLIKTKEQLLELYGNTVVFSHQTDGDHTWWRGAMYYPKQDIPKISIYVRGHKAQIGDYKLLKDIDFDEWAAYNHRSEVIGTNKSVAE